MSGCGSCWAKIPDVPVQTTTSVLKYFQRPLNYNLVKMFCFLPATSHNPTCSCSERVSRWLWQNRETDQDKPNQIKLARSTLGQTALGRLGHISQENRVLSNLNLRKCKQSFNLSLHTGARTHTGAHTQLTFPGSIPHILQMLQPSCDMAVVKPYSCTHALLLCFSTCVGF